MTLSMARCIGRASCDGTPSARGLCGSCYARHRDRGTLRNFPTMRERTAQLASQPATRALVTRKVARRSPQGAAAAAKSVERYRRRRYAERVELNGVLVHPHERHGYLTSYNIYGCRGALCRETLRYYRHTGETALPAARERAYGPEDCVEFRSGTP